jgi:hypothetical protein
VAKRVREVRGFSLVSTLHQLKRALDAATTTRPAHLAHVDEIDTHEGDDGQRPHDS